MTNLLKETIVAIKESGHTPDDIVFIGSVHSGHSCTWDEYLSLADFDYDSGFGSAKVATDLKIIFSDGQSMWRGDYDGSEWWEFSQPADLNVERKPIRILGGNSYLWGTLSSMN